MFHLDQLGIIKEKADEAILKERLKYSNIYDIIDSYVVKYNEYNSSDKIDSRIMVGGAGGVDLLLGRERSVDNYIYELYSEQALNHANDLANALAVFIKTAKLLYIDFK